MFSVRYFREFSRKEFTGQNIPFVIKAQAVRFVIVAGDGVEFGNFFESVDATYIPLFAGFLYRRGVLVEAETVFIFIALFKSAVSRPAGRETAAKINNRKNN